jgi:hypothetical protein
MPKHNTIGLFEALDLEKELNEFESSFERNKLKEI